MRTRMIMVSDRKKNINKDSKKIELLREKIKRKLHYERWEEYFSDYESGKFFKAYPESSEGVYIVGMVSGFGEEIKRGEAFIQYIHPIKLMPYEILTKLDGFSVSVYIKNNNGKFNMYPEKKIVFCEIDYDYRGYYRVKRIIQTKYNEDHFRDISNNIMLKEVEGLKNEANILERQFEELRQLIEDTNKDISQNKEFAAVVNKAVELLKEGEDITIESLKEKRSRLKRELELLNKVEEQIKKKESVIKPFIEKNKTILTAYTKRKKEFDDNCDRLNKLEDNIKDKKKLIEENRETKRKTDADLAEIKDQLAESMVELEKLRSEKGIEIVKAEIEEEKEKFLEKLDHEKNENDRISIELKNVEEILGDIKKRFHEAEQGRKKFQKALDSSMREKRNIEERLNATKSELSDLQARKETAESEIERFTAELEEAKEQAEDICSKLNTQKEENSRSTKELEIEKIKHKKIESEIKEYRKYIEDEKSKYLDYLKEFVKKVEKAEEASRKAYSDYKNETTFDGNIHVQLKEFVKGYLWNHQMYYKDIDRVVTQFLSAIGSGQIILLTGVPGTGKSSLPRYIGAATGALVEEIVIQPNWTDSQDILGYYNSNDKRYVSTPFLDVLINAQRDEESGKMYFIVLEEMNLAHVEYYFSMILSAMERDGRLSIISESDLSDLVESDDGLDKETLRNLRITDNIQFIGTINIDSLSKNISPKVIDRSFIIELALEEDRNAIMKTLYSPRNLEPVYTDKSIYTQSRVYRCSDNDESINDVSGKIKSIEEIYNVINDFYTENRARINGSLVRFSPRCRKRAEYMLRRGASAEDIILGRLLPCINWETTEKIFDDLKNKLEEISDMCDKDKITDKLEEMKDYYDGNIILDYWMSSRR